MLLVLFLSALYLTSKALVIVFCVNYCCNAKADRWHPLYHGNEMKKKDFLTFRTSERYRTSWEENANVRVRVQHLKKKMHDVNYTGTVERVTVLFGAYDEKLFSACTSTKDNNSKLKPSPYRTSYETVKSRDTTGLRFMISFFFYL